MQQNPLPKAYGIRVEIVSLRNSNHVTHIGKNAGTIVEDKIGRIVYRRKSDGKLVDAGLIAQGDAIKRAGEQLQVGKDRMLYGAFESVLDSEENKTGQYFRVIGRSFTDEERAAWSKKKN